VSTSGGFLIGVALGAVVALFGWFWYRAWR
jgi:hypothetical protein